VAVGAAAVGILVWRVLAWPAATGYDAWAYTAWGQALARLERPLYELGATTPKPLATLLALPVVPLPPERAFPLVVAVFAGVLAGALFAAARREAGTLAGVGALAALAFGVRLEPILWFGHSDAITAALVVLGVALQRWPRVAALVLAGLLRPEAWLVAGFAAAWEARGPLRRAAFGLGASVLPALLWLFLDLVLAGDALATQNWREGREPVDYGTLGPLGLAGRVWDRLTEAAHPLVVVAGVLGLALHLWRSRGRDPLPAVAVVLWIGALAVERELGIELNARYFLPVAALLALGCGLLAGAMLPERFRGRFPWPAAAAAVAILAVAAATMGFGPARREAARSDAVEDTLPLLERPLDCGILATTGTRQSAAVIPQLAASSRESLHRFAVYEPSGKYAAVLLFEAHRFESGRKARGLRRQAERAQLPPWPREETALGPLADDPDCA
jgi:hypothetical protein